MLTVTQRRNRSLWPLALLLTLSPTAGCKQDAGTASAGVATMEPPATSGMTTATPSTGGSTATGPGVPTGPTGPSAPMSAQGGATAAGQAAQAPVSGGGAGATSAGSSANTAGSSGASAGTAGGPPATNTPAGDMQSAEQIALAMLIGWNLGNSMDAVGGETAWGNPTVTPELIKAVAAAGFKVVRIPVTWVRHFGPGPTFTIEPAWLSRVAEIVGYVFDAGMYAIINVHHDGAEGGDGEWLSLRDGSENLSATHDMAVQQQFVALWQQIASHFAKHSDKLLFESMNEIKVGYDKPDPAYYKTITALNQAFVDTVRASGGNNTQRCLVVPGYNTNIEYTLEGFVTPTDPSPGRLILSVHYYDPWSFAGMGETHAWGTGNPGADNWGQEPWVDEQFDKLKNKYVSAGLPVIIGEYGAVHQADAQNYRRYYMEYVTKAAVDRGLVPIYWDNGGANSGSDGFGLFNRTSAAPLYPEVLSAMLRAATEDYPISAIAKP
jgi:endoglucanase